jgi:hypothetical protein
MAENNAFTKIKNFLNGRSHEGFVFLKDFLVFLHNPLVVAVLNELVRIPSSMVCGVKLNAQIHKAFMGNAFCKPFSLQVMIGQIRPKLSGF